MMILICNSDQLFLEEMFENKIYQWIIYTIYIYIYINKTHTQLQLILEDYT